MQSCIFFTGLIFGGIPSVYASTNGLAPTINLTDHWVGIASLSLFGLSYVFVVLEEKLHLRKCKPVLLAAGLIWLCIAFAYRAEDTQIIGDAIRHYLLEFAELFFFLLVAMTYVNAMIYKGVFIEMKNRLVQRRLSYRQLFWLTGILAFFISPIVDNLTTALIFCAVVVALGKDQPKFIGLACINIVVASNAGGAFSPFGDITTLMVWQRGVVNFWEFFNLFIPSLVNFVVPAMIMQFAVPKGLPSIMQENESGMRKGGGVIVCLFLFTVATTVLLHSFFHIPPVFGMMVGLAYLKLYDYFLQQRDRRWTRFMRKVLQTSDDPHKFSVFDSVAQAEWDTLFFFYGVIMAVGGLGFIGYLEFTSVFMYQHLGATTANILVGILSALVDNIPVMFAVLAMRPEMSHEQWLLVTLTAGVGGSILSIGSAAGIALMGQARDHYTFMQHLRWAPVIALGFAASILAHVWVNGL